MSFEVRTGEDDTKDRCIVCGKVIRPGDAYAHIKHGDQMVSLCCPFCTEAFQKSPAYFVTQREARKLLRSQKRKGTQEG